MSKFNTLRTIQFFILLILIAAIIGGVYLVRHPTVFKPKAGNNQSGIEFLDAQGNIITSTNTQNVKLKLTYVLHGANPAPTPTPPLSRNPNVYILNIDDNMDSVSGLTGITIVKKFYQNNPDKVNEYDFIALFPSFRPQKDYDNAFGTVTFNQVRGICLNTQKPDPNVFGSVKLQGIEIYRYENILNSLSSYRGGNGALLLEETAHRWIVYIGKSDGQSPGDSIGIPPSCRNTDLPLLVKNSTNWTHWSGGLQMPDGHYGAMREAQPWVDNGDGTYSIYSSFINQPPKKFHPFDLYLMGLADKSEVTGSYLLLSNIQYLNKNTGDSTVKADAQRITIDDIIKIAGEPRSLDAAHSQKDFKIAFVILTKQGQPAPQDLVDNITTAANNFPSQWAYATGYRSTMNKDNN